jgi:hypothetical protein
MIPEKKDIIPAPYATGFICHMREGKDGESPMKKKLNHFDIPALDIVVPPVDPSIKLLSNKKRRPDMKIIKNALAILLLPL